MSIIGILKIMEVQEDDMEVQEEAVLHPLPTKMDKLFKSVRELRNNKFCFKLAQEPNMNKMEKYFFEFGIYFQMLFSDYKI